MKRGKGFSLKGYLILVEKLGSEWVQMQTGEQTRFLFEMPARAKVAVVFGLVEEGRRPQNVDSI